MAWLEKRPVDQPQRWEMAYLLLQPAFQRRTERQKPNLWKTEMGTCWKLSTRTTQSPLRRGTARQSLYSPRMRVKIRRTLTSRDVVRELLVLTRNWAICLDIINQISVKTILLAVDYFSLSRSVSGLVQPSGKRQYDRDFLLGFQFMAACVQKPEGLPQITDVVLDKVSAWWNLGFLFNVSAEALNQFGPHMASLKSCFFLKLFTAKEMTKHLQLLPWGSGAATLLLWSEKRYKMYLPKTVDRFCSCCI